MIQSSFNWLEPNIAGGQNICPGTGALCITSVDLGKCDIHVRIGADVAASFADTDNDGDPDLYVTTTRHGNAFFVNDGQGRFEDRTANCGLEYSGHSSTGVFFDYDRDGRLDLLLTNVGKFTTDEIGYSGDPTLKESPYYIGSDKAFGGHMYWEMSEQSILYHNEGDNHFRDVSDETGLKDRGWSGDATPLDANRDGWTDLYVTNDFNSPPMVLISNLSERNPAMRYLEVQLRGTKSGSDGLGAIIQVSFGDQVRTQVHDGKSGYLSQSLLPLYFGLGTADVIDKITVRWPDGAQQIIQGPVAANQAMLITEE